MLYLQLHDGELAHPIQVLEDYFRNGGVSLIQAAFAHTYFVHPEAVRQKTPYFPNRARRSREHYPGLEKGQQAIWHGDGREVVLDDNQHAQMAWERYTGHGLSRGTGYSIRHIWGEPWDPDLFTAGWNLCYMPFWAGMLTERHHPHPELERSIRQASWDLYFRHNPVCDPPECIADPGLDLSRLLAGQPILILQKSSSPDTGSVSVEPPQQPAARTEQTERIRQIRSQAHQSWSNIRKAVRSLQGLHHQPFGTPNVENSAKSCARKIQAETGLDYAEIEALMDGQGW